MDGRDVRQAQRPFLHGAVRRPVSRLGKGRLASMIRRFFAMDRDNRWDRVQQAYDLMTQGKGEFTADNATDAAGRRLCPRRNDEFVKATRSRADAP
ncbi:hypothetical protein ACNKHQ_21080 [Shigella flexneri]